MLPPKWGHFWTQGHNFNELAGGPLGDAQMLHNKYHGSMQCSFRREDIFTFSLCNTCDPNLNKLCRGPLGDTNIKAIGIVVLDKMMFKFFYFGCHSYQNSAWN